MNNAAFYDSAMLLELLFIAMIFLLEKNPASTHQNKTSEAFAHHMHEEEWKTVLGND